MNLIANILVVLVAVLHLGFLALEMVFATADLSSDGVSRLANAIIQSSSAQIA